jgi:hypothetical protein
MQTNFTLNYMNTELFGVTVYFYHLYNFSYSCWKYIAKVLREIKHSLTDFQSNWNLFSK